MRVGTGTWSAPRSIGVSAKAYQELKTTLHRELLGKIDLEKLTSLEDVRARAQVQQVIQDLIVDLANGLPGTRPIGKHRHAFRVVSSSGQDPQDLLHAAGREYTGATHKGRPPRRRPGGSPAENCRRPSRAGRAERSRPAGAGRTWPSRRHH